MPKLYEQMLDGETMTIPDGGIDVACCSCGLVHRFRVVGGGSVRVRVKMMPRATAQIRRWMRKKREGVFGPERKKTPKSS